MLSDPRSLRKLRIIDHQIDTDFEAEKWSKSVIKQVREASKSEGKKAVLKNNNTSVEIEMERKRKKKLSTPLSVSASADMDSRASTLLRLLKLNKDSNAHTENEEHLLDCKFRQKKTVKTTRKKKKCSPKPSLEVSSTSRTADKDKVKMKSKSKSEGREKSTKTSDSKRCGVEASPILTSSRSSDRGSVKGSVRGSDKGTPSTASTVKSRGSKTSDSKILRKKISSKGEDRTLDSVDEGFRNFHYSVNLLRDSILQGTVAARCDTSSRTAGEEDEDDDEEGEDGEEEEDEEEDEVSDSAGSDTNQNLNSRDTRDLSSRSSASQAMRNASVASYSLSLRDSMVDNYEDFALTRNARPRPSGVGVGVLMGPRSAPSQPERTEQDWVNWAKMGARAPLEDRDFEGFFPPKDSEEEEEEGREYGTDGPRSDTPPESSSTHEYENQNPNQHSYADDMNDSDSESESDSDDGLISYDLPDEGSPGRGADRAFEGNMIGSRMSPSAASRGRERDGGDGDGEGIFGDDSAAVMIGDRGPWGGNDSSSGKSYESESSEEDEEEEEEEEEQQRNRYRTNPAGYSDSVPAVSDYRGPTSDILNSYMNEIYST